MSYSEKGNKLEVYIARVNSTVKHNLGDKFLGSYIHGSVAQNAFMWNRSDVDVLVVSKKELTPVERKIFVDDIRCLSEVGPAKGIEISVISEEELRNGHHPFIYECHFSPFWDRYVRNDGWENYGDDKRKDEDIASHIFNLRNTGIVLDGPAIKDVFPCISKDAFMQSISYDEHDAPTNMVDSIMNLCRYHIFLCFDELVSKEEGVKRVIELYPEQKDFLMMILNEFLAGTVYLPDDLSNKSKRFKEFILKERI